jgi:hypothetical protein
MSEKITKLTGDVAHAAECLLCKCEALSSNPKPKTTKQSNKQKTTSQPTNQPNKQITEPKKQEIL